MCCLKPVLEIKKTTGEIKIPLIVRKMTMTPRGVEIVSSGIQVIGKGIFMIFKGVGMMSPTGQYLRLVT
jgi:hypothetical protein